ncbi:hypothetical protein M3Y97_00399100 [Aphelenchoides bicaudatus]|nr:hypothetical protein M3Y97_00399100 [Aphelenchoides bicaudatus]
MPNKSGTKQHFFEQTSEARPISSSVSSVAVVDDVPLELVMLVYMDAEFAMQNGNSHNNQHGMDFEVVPENCLRNEHLVLALGTPINQAICALKNASRLIRNIELIYDNREPFSRDIVIMLKNDGIKLTFDPKQQLLKLIEVYDFNHITLHYCNTVFSAPDQPADVAKVERCFGATHPGVYDEKYRTYLLHWRGVSFSFPAKEPSTVQPAYAHGLGSLNFSNSSLPLLEKMGIYCGNNSSPTEIQDPEMAVNMLCGNLYPIHIESVNEDTEIVGLKITYVAEDFDTNAKKISELPQKQKRISFGDTEQSVVAALGAPSKDILLDFDTRTVTKFVLHTNLIGHYDFGEYTRPSFEIKCTARQGPFSSETLTINTNSKLENFRAAFTDESGSCNPVVVNRTSANDGENPFGSTFCYGNDQIIVEVMDNSYIATLTLYGSNSQESSGSEDQNEDGDDIY